MTLKAVLGLGAIAGLALGSSAAMAHGDMDPNAPHDFMFRLSGPEQIPGPGDEDAHGVFMASFNDESQICYYLEVMDLDTPTAAHIHTGAVGEAGPPVVVLETPVVDEIKEVCTAVDPELAAQIKADPAGYYVNVHNAPFPAGAIRGQLNGGM